MSAKEQQVLELYYFKGLTMKQVGGVLGVGESRVSQIHSMAVSQLRTRLGALTGADQEHKRAAGAASGA